MAQLWVTTRTGDSHEVEVADGLSVMEAIRDAGIDELLALCGGCLSCATCHVFVDPKDIGKLVPANSDEIDLLDSAESRNATSRLACQLRFDGSFDSLRVVIAPEE